MPSTPNSQFYVVGGTVNPDSPSYVVRKADQELYDRLLAGEFCYVLTSRQMGKSSLMARTARRLTNEAHIHAAIVDLTQIGTERDKLSSEQWYYGIAHRILRELKLRDVNLSEWWQSRAQLPALQRLTEFFRDLLLEQITGQIVIFIDEIDSTISLPFTDDFFAAIRACHNARATDAAYNRLSFVLLGVASPSDLVKDSTRTPFNVGQRIELTDFTAEEAKPLAAGLSANPAEGEQILARILDWTGGHPYLTQKLCGAMQSPGREEVGIADVDALVEQNFLSQTASRDDSNLNFVRDWMKGDKRLGVKVFKLYRSIRRGKPIADAPRSPVQNHLKLSGVVALQPDKTLRVRNQVYEQVFTDQWAKKATPVDWNRRLAVASAAMLLLSIGFWYLVWNPRQYIAPIQNALDDYPGRYYEALHRYPWYAGKADELMAQFWERRALSGRGWGRDEALLNRLQALLLNPTELRRKEANILVGSDYQNLEFTFRHGDPVSAVAFSRDGKHVLTGSWDKTARLWNAETGQPIGDPLGHDGYISTVAFSPDGKRVVTGSWDKTAKLWDSKTGQLLGKPLIHGAEVSAIAISPNGKRLLVGSKDGTAKLWEIDKEQTIGKPFRHDVEITAVAFSPDGKWILTGSADGSALIWDAQVCQPIGHSFRHNSSIFAVAFNYDGTLVLTGGGDGIARLWNVQTGQPIGEPFRHGSHVYSAAISLDEKYILTGGFDHSALLWDMKSGKLIGDRLRHEGSVLSVAFSPDAKRILTGSEDGTARVWRIKTNPTTTNKSLSLGSEVSVVAISPDGKRIMTGFSDSDGTVRIWDIDTGQQDGALLRLGEPLSDIVYSQDGKQVLVGSVNGTSRLFDAQTGHLFGPPLPHVPEILVMALSPDLKRLLTGGRSGLVRQWDTQTGQPVGKILHSDGPVRAVAVSPDGKRVIIVNVGGMIQQRDLDEGHQIGEPLYLGGFVDSAVYSPDGKRVLIQANQWLYLVDVIGSKLIPKASRFLSGTWKGGYRFLDPHGDYLQIAERAVGDFIKLEIVRFDVPEAPPIQGGPAALLQDWLRRLGLKFDPGQNYKLVPLYPVESSRTTSSPFN